MARQFLEEEKKLLDAFVTRQAGSDQASAQREDVREILEGVEDFDVERALRQSIVIQSEMADQIELMQRRIDGLTKMLLRNMRTVLELRGADFSED